MKTASVIDVSNYLTVRFQVEGIPLTPLKLQKVLYYLQAWHLVFFDKHPLFEEFPEAWVNGPVYRPVYNQFNGTFYRNNPIELDIKEEELIDRLKEAFEKLELTHEQEQLLEAIIKKYGFMSAEKLVYLTHMESPWNEARQSLKPFEKSTNKIDKEVIYNYYNSRRQQQLLIILTRFKKNSNTKVKI